MVAQWLGRHRNPMSAAPVMLVVLVFIVSGCVSHTDSRFTRSADAERAEEAYIQLGLAYLQEEDFDRSRRSLNRALEINSRSARAMVVLGMVNQEEGEYELAEERFRNALRVDSGLSWGRLRYGEFLFMEGRYEDAYDQFERASRDTEFSERSVAFENLAITAERLGRTDEVIRGYRRAVQLDRNNRPALEGLIDVLIREGQIDDAIPHYQRLLARIRSSSDITHSAASAWAGIRIARFQGDEDAEASLVLLLRNEFPMSREFREMQGAGNG